MHQANIWIHNSQFQVVLEQAATQSRNETRWMCMWANACVHAKITGSPTYVLARFQSDELKRVHTHTTN